MEKTTDREIVSTSHYACNGRALHKESGEQRSLILETTNVPVSYFSDKSTQVHCTHARCLPSSEQYCAGIKAVKPELRGDFHAAPMRNICVYHRQRDNKQ